VCSSKIILLQGWNKKWDEWVEATGLTKYKKELAKVEFTQEGEGGTREFGGRAEAGQGKGRAEGGRKADKAQRQGNGVSSKVSYLIDAHCRRSFISASVVAAWGWALCVSAISNYWPKAITLSML